jgi:hypothetical protein
MSHKNIEKNPAGFLKTFCCKAEAILNQASKLGYPYARPERRELTLKELFKESDRLLHLLALCREWSVRKYDIVLENNDAFIDIIKKIDYLAKRYGNGVF